MPNGFLGFLLPAAAALMWGCEGGTGSAPEGSESVAPEAESMPDVAREEAAPEVNSDEPDADECGADKLGRWLNVLPTETVKAQIRDTVGHDRIRYIAPGDVVTMDLRPDRLNVETGEDGRIALFRCG
jgi:hypothetical protein